MLVTGRIFRLNSITVPTWQARKSGIAAAKSEPGVAVGRAHRKAEPERSKRKKNPTEPQQAEEEAKETTSEPRSLALAVPDSLVRSGNHSCTDTAPPPSPPESSSGSLRSAKEECDSTSDEWTGDEEFLPLATRCRHGRSCTPESTTHDEQGAHQYRSKPALQYRTRIEEGPMSTAFLERLHALRRPAASRFQTAAQPMRRPQLLGRTYSEPVSHGNDDAACPGADDENVSVSTE
jgi:hypothetical protein